jgi:hypothetical protein
MATLKALLVGINTYGTKPLRGCVNDVKQMQAVLQRYYGFQPENMRILTDGEATSANVKGGLEWLAGGGSEPDAVRVFHYSGHGSYVADENGDEPDGRDECLVPVDYRTAGLITDDTLKTFYDRFPRSANLTLVMDSCHSGTVQKDMQADIVAKFLPVSLEEQERIDQAAARFVEDQREFIVTELSQPRGEPLSEAALRQKVRELMSTFEKKRFGDVRVREANILLAGCRADQQSADAFINGDYHGAFTYFIGDCITQSHGNISHRQLAEQVGRLLRAGGFVQIPQLECCGERDHWPAFRSF